MPDPTGLELLAQAIEERHPDAAPVASHRRGRAELRVSAPFVREVLEVLRGEGYGMLVSVHGVDYFPQEPRFGVLYELLSMAARDRVAVKVRVPEGVAVPAVTPNWPAANYHEREVYDMFGVPFEGHPDLRRILMPEDYLGHPQRRDYPIGGEPVIFTHNDADTPGWFR